MIQILFSALIQIIYMLQTGVWRMLCVYCVWDDFLPGVCQCYEPLQGHRRKLPDPEECVHCGQRELCQILSLPAPGPRPADLSNMPSSAPLTPPCLSDPDRLLETEEQTQSSKSTAGLLIRIPFLVLIDRTKSVLWQKHV